MKRNSRRKYVNRILSFENILPAIIIFTAFVITLQPKIFGVEISQTNVVLSLFSLLALDTLVQRIITLHNMQESIRKIEAAIALEVSADNVLRTRKQFPRMEDIVSKAEKEIFISGINLEGAVVVINSLKEKLNSGITVRLLALDPNGNSLGASCTLSNIRPELRKRKIENNLALLFLSFAHIPSGWEIKVIDSIFPAGFIGIDTQSSRGEIIAQHYLYQATSEKQPLIILKGEDSLWYTTYRQQIELLWADGLPYHHP